MCKKYLFSCLAVSLALLFLAGAVDADLSEITFPIPELGNCANREACKAYCDEPEHIITCLDFAAGHALIPQEEVDRIKDELQKLNKFGLTEGPGGCRSDSECRAYCDQVAHMEECVAFAESHGLMPATILQQAKKIAQSEAQGISSPGGCTTKAECEAYCSIDAHLEECVAFGVAIGFISEEEAAMIRQMGTMRGPGGCMSGETCKEYCDNPDHFEECIEFAVEHGLMDEEEADMVKKIGPGGGPGGCEGREQCEAYCNDPAHMEECLAFAEVHGLISKEEAERIRKMSEMERMGPLTGPGGCEGKEECDAYCQQPANMEECMKFAKEHGFMDDEEIRRAERLMPLMMEMAGPGGCRSPYECDFYCSDPDHMQECMNFAETHGIMHEDELRKAEMFMREDFVGPGGCTGHYECDMYCMKPENQEECMEFGRKMGLIGEREEMMLREMEIMREMPIEGFIGPGGCRSEKECFEFCFKPENFSICGRFGDMPPPDMTMPTRPDMMIGPGGCMSEVECRQYCSNPAHAMECGYAFAGVCGDGRCEPGEYCPKDCEMAGEGMGCGMIREREKCEAQPECTFCEGDPYPCYPSGHICRSSMPVVGGFCGDGICEMGEYCPPDCMSMPECGGYTDPGTCGARGCRWCEGEGPHPCFPPEHMCGQGFYPGPMPGEPCGFAMCALGDWCADPYMGWCCPFGMMLCPDGRCEPTIEICKQTSGGGWCGDGRCDMGEYCPMDCMGPGPDGGCGMIMDPYKCKVNGCNWCESEGGMYPCFPPGHICMTGPTGWCGDGYCEPGEYCPMDCEVGMNCGMYMNREKCIDNGCLFCEGDPYPCYPMGHICGSQPTVHCGNRICEMGESPASCPEDCGAPVPPVSHCIGKPYTTSDGHCDFGQCPNGCHFDSYGCPFECLSSTWPDCPPNEFTINAPRADCNYKRCLMGCEFSVREGSPGCPVGCMESHPGYPCGAAMCTADEWCASPTNGWCCPWGTEICPDGTCVKTISECTTTGYCGDNICSSAENPTTCPTDCQAECFSCYCGSGMCDPGETPENCPEDCSGVTECPSNSYNGFTSGFTCNWNHCPNGCTFDGAGCPNGCAAAGYCGDGMCNVGEGAYSCPSDCGDMNCGNNYTDATCKTAGCVWCSDTALCYNPGHICGSAGYCGDGICNNAETVTSCPTDCGTGVVCSDIFDETTCRNTIECAVWCSGEAYPCHSAGHVCAGTGYCGDGMCNNAETVVTCPTDCGNTAECPSNSYNGFTSSYTCDWSYCSNGCTFDSAGCPNGCAIAGYCGDGMCDAGEDEYSCSSDCVSVGWCGDGACDSGEDEYSCPTDCGNAGYCGDGMCDTGEDEYSCPSDCGPSCWCGDGMCNCGEDSYSCSSDCGSAGYCGDGMCDAGEDEYSCSSDCVSVGWCGDGACDSGEDEYSCPTDCGSTAECPSNSYNGFTSSYTCDWSYCSNGCTFDSAGCPNGCAIAGYCGDGMCDAGEDEYSCSSDCGSAGWCGDGACDSYETPESCPEDCGGMSLVGRAGRIVTQFVGSVLKAFGNLLSFGD